MVYVVALLSILLGAVAQVLLKMGVAQVGLSQMSVAALLALLANLRFLLGLLSYGLSLLLWLHVLSQIEVSRAYPMVSLGYIVTMFIAWVWLGEPLGAGKVAGTCLIVIGVFLISKF